MIDRLLRIGRGRLGVLVVVAVLSSACSTDTDPQAVPGNPDVQVTLGLARDQAGLEEVALAVNDPGSESYGRFLTIEEIARRFGADERDRDRVVSYLDGVGAETSVHPTGLLVTATLPAESAEDTFGVTLEERSSHGVSYLALADEPRVPEELDGIVTEIVGFARTVPSEDEPATEPPAGADTDGTSAAAAAEQPECLEARAALRALEDHYGITTLQEHGDGAGVRVAATGIVAPDERSIEVWTECLGLRPVDVEITSTSVTTRVEPDAESALDVALILGIAPGVDAFDYLEFDQFGWVGDPYAAALGRPHVPDVISSSVGFCEPSLRSDDVELGEAVLAAAAAIGVTVVVASGDDGATCRSGLQPAVQYPAASAFVTAVGGTQWVRGRDGGVTDEKVWNTGAQATGGGGSRFVDRPHYQVHDTEDRRIPDLSLLAAAEDLPLIPVCGRGEGCVWDRLGGTSASAPIVAAALALIEAQLRERGAGIGHPVPRLYRDDDWRLLDVTRGSSRLGGVGGYRAEVGHDAASGWGTPRFDLLVADGRPA